MRNSTKVFAALLTGLAAGTALGILIAPNEGRETRESMCNSIIEFKYSFAETAKDEVFRFTNWRRRLLALVKAQFLGPELEMPDDLEHG